MQQISNLRPAMPKGNDCGKLKLSVLKRPVTKSHLSYSSLIFFPDRQRCRYNPVEDHVVSVHPDAPGDQDQRRPQVSTRRRQEGPGGPPVDQIGI